MSYVDGFLAAVPVDGKSGYIAYAEEAAPIFLEYGALQVVENWADDVPHGKTTDFHRAVKAEVGEAVVFSWVVWPDKATRDEAWKKMMDDPRMDPAGKPMPFDGKRLVYGGFTNVVDAGGSGRQP